MAEMTAGGEQDLLVDDPWRRLARRYEQVRRPNDIPQVEVNRPGLDLEGFQNRLKRSLDISTSANRLSETLAQNAAERRRMEEAKWLQQNWGSVDLSGVSPEYLQRHGLSYQDVINSGKGSSPTGSPLATQSRVTSGYGMRKHPVSGIRKTHTGIDFSAGAGTPIYATHSGTVARAGYNGAWGNQVVLNGASGMASMYAHQSRVAVRPGQQIAKGQVIGYVGSTGSSTGNHLHYEVWVNGRPVNPNSYL